MNRLSIFATTLVQAIPQAGHLLLDVAFAGLLTSRKRQKRKA